MSQTQTDGFILEKRTEPKDTEMMAEAAKPKGAGTRT